MVNQAEEKIRELFEGTIDFKGQDHVESTIHYWLIITTAVSFVVGLAFQDISYTFKLFFGSSALLALYVVPPWPFLTRNPVTWLPEMPPSHTKKSQ
ncbi:hypothetical protein FRB90_000344 [Tulasnella sp. 427]|nr:hypothetical protein FRB90_000344 [Tulasnella sp. 427]